MAVPSDRLQQIIENKDTENALASVQKHGYVEGWAIINDEAMVIYDVDDPPVWLKPILDALDEDGDTPPELAGVTLMRKPREGEYVEGSEPDLVPMEAVEV